MSLSEDQQEFALHIGYLLQHINAAGYACTFGDAYRSPKAFGGMGEKGPYGHINSQHKLRLAVDLNLFKNGRYLSDSESHRPFAEYWEALHPDNRSGIHWNDGNHYERNCSR